MNSIRVYHVDASKDHSDCMSTLADAGIYLLVDLDTFDTYILPVRPVPSPRRLVDLSILLSLLAESWPLTRTQFRLAD